MTQPVTAAPRTATDHFDVIRVRNLDSGKDYLSHEDLDTAAEEERARADAA